MRYVVFAMLVLFAVLCVPQVSEARCGRGGFRPHRLRHWFQNHRPHILFRGGCR